MKSTKRFLISTFTAAFTAGTLVLVIPACGTAPDDTAATEDSAGSFNGDGPYPNIKGGEVKGDKNFATLINKYAQGTGDKGWAAFWWPYTSNGIASGAYGGGSSHGGGGQSPAG